MATSIAIRLNVEGGAELRRTMDDAGRSGQQAFQTIGTAADAAGTATDRLTQKVRQAGEAGSAGRPSGSAAVAAAAAPPSASVREVERLRVQLDEEFRKQQQAERADRIIGAGQSSGAYTEAYATRLRDLAGRKYGHGNDNAPGREGLSSYDRSFIRYQGFDVASSLGAGASATTVVFQQGPQVLQQLADREGGLTAGLKQLGTTAAGLVTPFTVAGAAAVGATAVFALAASSYARDQTTLTNSLKLTGRSTEATVSQLDALARSNAEAGKVSTSTAREIVAAYANTGEIGTGVLDTLIQRTGDYAKLTGQDVPSATAELAKMFADPARGAEGLANKLGGIDDKTRQYIITLAEQGDKTSAQIALSEAFRIQIVANVEATTAWGSAWNFVTSTADKAYESIKRAAGGAVNTPQQALDTLNERLKNTEAARPAGDPFLVQLRAERDAKQSEVDRAQREAEERAAVAQAAKDSVRAGTAARSLDPQFARASEIDRQMSDIRAGLDNPRARAGMDASTIEASERALDGLTRARASMRDENGKLITSEQLVRRQGELSIEAAKATTAAEKAAVAEKQARLELIGKTVSASSAEQRVTTAGIVARLGADSKGGKGDADTKDDYDRALKSLEDRTRRLKEQADTYGMGAEAVERYRSQTELLTAVQRSEREITPELTADIARHADAAAEAAKRMEDVREASKRTDDMRSVGSDGVRTLVRDLAEGAKAGKIMDDVLASIRSRVADLASNSLNDLLFGQRGTSGTGSLGGLLGRLFGLGGGSSGTTDFSEEGLGSSAIFAARGYVPRFAAGVTSYGLVTGPGTGTSDSILARISNGESIVTAEATRRHGPLIRAMNENRLPGFASGFTMPSPMGAAGAGAGSGPPSINFITPPGMAIEAAGAPQRNASGGYDQVLRAVENGMGKRAADSRGPFKGVVAGAAYRNG